MTNFMNLPDFFARCLTALRAKRLWVGFSGGLDSTVALHALAQLKQQCLLPMDLLAVHVNHGLSPSATQWQAHCEARCRELGIPLHVKCVAIDARSEGIEAAARRARYGVFAELMGPGDVMICAHHADDQAETLLLRLLRGAGPDAICGMPAMRECGYGTIWRPMLSLPRAELLAWAESEQLQWIRDQSNDDCRFDRNYLRRQVMPLLQARWPGYAERWQRTTALAQQRHQHWQSEQSDKIQALDWRSEQVGMSFSLSAWRALVPTQRQALFRLGLQRQGWPQPEAAQWHQLERQCLDAASDRHVQVIWSGLQLRRFHDRVWIMPLAEQSVPQDTTWDGVNPMVWGPGVLRLVGADSGPQRLRYGPGYAFRVRLRHSQDRCQPVGRAHSQTLKKLFQEQRVEPWLRPVMPLLCASENNQSPAILAVGDRWVCAGAEAKEGEPGWRVCWHPNDNGNHDA